MESIRARQTRAPAAATSLPAGHRKGRGRAGRVILSTSTPRHTRKKANRVPMLQRKASLPMGVYRRQQGYGGAADERHAVGRVVPGMERGHRRGQEAVPGHGEEHPGLGARSSM